MASNRINLHLHSSAQTSRHNTPTARETAHGKLDRLWRTFTTGSLWDPCLTYSPASRWTPDTISTPKRNSPCDFAIAPSSSYQKSVGFQILLSFTNWPPSRNRHEQSAGAPPFPKQPVSRLPTRSKTLGHAAPLELVIGPGRTKKWGHRVSYQSSEHGDNSQKT